MIGFFSAHQGILIWISGISLVFFIFSIAMLPWFAARIPADYFTRLENPGEQLVHSRKFSVVKVLAAIFKNCAGIILFLAGVVMLFTPGQGLLTMVAGAMLANFPYKKRLLKHIASIKSVQTGLNWLRAKKNVPPLHFS